MSQASQYQPLAITPAADVAVLSNSLYQHVQFKNGVGADRVVRELLDQDRLLLASNVFTQKIADPFSIATRLIEVLESPHVQDAPKLKLSTAKLTRLFLELTCMKVHSTDHPISKTKKLKRRINDLLTQVNEDEVGLRQELICCVEAAKLMKNRKVKSHMVQISLAIQYRQTPKPIEPVWLDESWYLRVFYASWIGGLTIEHPKDCRRLISCLKSTDQFALKMARIELCGDLLRHGSEEIKEIARKKLYNSLQSRQSALRTRAEQLLKLKHVRVQTFIAD